MTEQELRKLNRIELLEIMLEQGKEIDQLKDIIADQEAQLADRAIKIDRAGTVMEASLAINGVLETVQKAADQYLENIRTLSENQEAILAREKTEIEDKCEAMISEVENECCLLKEEADAYYNERKAEADSLCAQQREETDTYCTQKRAEADAYCEQKKAETDAYCAEKRAIVDEEFAAVGSDVRGYIEKLEKETEEACAKRRAAADRYYAEMRERAAREVESRLAQFNAQKEESLRSNS